MSPVSLSLASPVYDRMVPLATGEVTPAGTEFNFIQVNHPREVFDRMVKNEEFDASELSSSEYISQCAKASSGDGKTRFVAIPVFPLRSFRHGFIAVNTERVKCPADLAGKRVGVQMYTMTAAVWIRGLLKHEYGVDCENIVWVEGRFDKPGAHGKSTSVRGVDGRPPPAIIQNDSSKSINQLLADGEIDATIGAEVPDCLWDNESSPHIQRLFPDYKEVEKAYFRKTGIYPIMHLVVIRREVYERHKWVATSLYRACNEAKELVRKRTYMPGMIQAMLPWIRDALEKTKEVFGEDFWPYGLKKNRKTLEALVLYLYEQGLIEKRLSLEELFVPVQEEAFVHH